MADHYDSTRNRFNPQNRFIGDIEDGKRYPFDCYTKEESDNKYAPIGTESDISHLTDQINSKADASTVTELSGTVSTLETTVNGKANESEIAAINARLDALEYQEISINSFTASPTTIEMGTNATIDLVWSLNKQATSQEINGTEVTGNSRQYSNVTTNQSYTLTVSDGHTNDTKSVNVTFANQIYYGAAANADTITGLSKVLSNNPKRTITVNAGEGQYIYYAYPARLGNVSFYVGGFEGGFELASTSNLTNSKGYTESYKIYKSINANLGNTTVEIKEG